MNHPNYEPRPVLAAAAILNLTQSHLLLGVRLHYMLYFDVKKKWPNVII